MAVSFTSAYYPENAVTTLGAVDVATQVNVPVGARRVTIQLVGNAGKLSFVQTLTDGGPIGTPALPVAAGAMFDVPLDDNAGARPPVPKFFISGDVASTICHFLIGA